MCACVRACARGTLSVRVCAQGRNLWVDMESSLRTVLKDNTDVFDANKAMACVRCVIEQGLEPAPAAGDEAS